MAKGYVYIFTNPCLEGWVKIGMTERNDINSRLNELNSPSNLPFSFRCYATYEVEDALNVEQNIHIIINETNASLRARELLDNGKIREREFFRLSPEQAYKIFYSVAKLRGETDKLKLYAPTSIENQEEEISERQKKKNTSFSDLNIKVGEKITFLYDDTITATVHNDKNTIEYENQVYTVTGLAKKILIEKYGWAKDLHINGWKYFTKEGVSLFDLRNSIEENETNSSF